MSQEQEQLQNTKQKKFAIKMKNKTGSTGWIAFIILLILILLGIGAYFLFTGNSSLGSSIPQPPTLPS